MDAHMMKRSLFIVMLVGSLNILNSVCATQWSSPAFIPGSAGAFNAAVAMDASGNALVAWQASTANNPVIRIAYYSATGQSWSSVKELGAAYYKSYVYVSMGIDGTSIIAWIDDQQVVQTVCYAQENWQAWQPELISKSLPTDKANILYMPQTFFAKTYLTWASSSGAYVVSYDITGNDWSAPITLMSSPCYNLSGVVDALGNAIFAWIATNNSGQPNIFATRYDATQSWNTWTPMLQVISQAGFCPTVGISSPNNQAGTAIFTWFGAKGLQAALYNPTIPWQTWNPADTQKLIGISTLLGAQVAMDALGNALFVMQTPNVQCQQIQYSAAQTWSAWQPQGTVIIQGNTVVNDVVMNNAQNGLIMLSSAETGRLNTLYIASTEPADVPVAFNRSCIASSQKMLALQQGADEPHAIAVWPSMPAKGICYLVS